MKKRAFCVASLVLVAFALCVDFGAKGQFSKNIRLRAQSVTVATEQKQQMRAEADRFKSSGNILGVVGLGFAVSSLACLLMSFRRHESAWWRSIPVALLVFYVMLQFMLV